VATNQKVGSSGAPLRVIGLLVAAKTLAGTAIVMFKDPSMAEAAKKDLEERKKTMHFTY